MYELDKPRNMQEFQEQTRQWFDRIDIDLNGTIDGVEIRKEFERLKNGLRWKNVGFNKPGAGHEINNKALSDALMSGKIEPTTAGQIQRARNVLRLVYKSE